MIKEGIWILKSEKDSRWNAEGRGLVGGFSIPPDAENHIDKKKEELKEEPPDDLKFSYMKD